MKTWLGYQHLKPSPNSAGVPNSLWRCHNLTQNQLEDFLGHWSQSEGLVTSERQALRKRPVLIFSKIDSEVAVLFLRLQELGIATVAIDLDRVLFSGRLTLASQGSKLQPLTLKIELGDQSYTITRPRSVFFADANATELLDEYHLSDKTQLKAHERVHLSRWRFALQTLEAAYPDVPWYPAAPSHLFRGEWDRALDLALAKQNGFATPKFILSNSEDEVCRFAQDHAPLALRETAFRTLLDGQQNLYLPIRAWDTRDVRRELRDHDLALSPTLWVEFIRSTANLRFVVTTKEVFHFEIKAKSGARAVAAFDAASGVASEHHAFDWRLRPLDQQYRLLKTPTPLKRKLQKILKTTGFQYISVDALRGPQKDSLVFLEINRPGAWFFLEALTGAPISSHLAHHLAGK